MRPLVLLARGRLARAGAGRRGRCGRRSLACGAWWLRCRAASWFFQEGLLLQDLHQGLFQLGRARRAQVRRPTARFVDGRAWLGRGVVRRRVAVLIRHAYRADTRETVDHVYNFRTTCNNNNNNKTPCIVGRPPLSRLRRRFAPPLRGATRPARCARRPFANTKILKLLSPAPLLPSVTLGRGSSVCRCVEYAPL